MRFLTIVDLALVLGALPGLPVGCGTQSPETSPSDPSGRARTKRAPGTETGEGAGPAEAARSVPRRVAPPPPAFERRLRIDGAENGIDLDGSLSEWPPLTEAEVATEAGAGPRLGIGLATDGSLLCVAARLRGWRSSEGMGEERIHIRLWFSRGGSSGPPWDLKLVIPPSRVGEGHATRASGAGPAERIAGARTRVESHDDGFDLEAAVPWSAFPPAELSRLGLRVAVGYEAGPGGQVVGIGFPDGVLAPMPVEQSLLLRLQARAARQWPGATRSWLDAGADFPHLADVWGDSRFERIGRIGGLVTVCRLEGRAGEGDCVDLDYGDDARIEGIETRDASGRGKPDLVVRYWRPGTAADHLVLEVVTFGPGFEPTSVFGHELSVYMHCCGSEANAPPHLRSEASVEPGRIEIRAERAWRLNRRAFTEPPLGGGVFPIVTPWDEPPVRRYVYRQGRFVPE